MQFVVKINGGRVRKFVDTIQQASAEHCRYRDENGLGSSEMDHTLIYDEDNQVYAHVSYNGRVFAGHPHTKSVHAAPLCEAQA
jgi:catabolite regulation protein CreA